MRLVLSLIILVISLLISWYCFTNTPPSTEDYATHLTDKVVLICGASSGIGEVLAYRLARRGAKLMLVARTESKLQRVRENALKHGSPHVEYMSYDFSDVGNSHTVVDKAVEVFGQLDYLVLNHASMVSGMFLHFKRHQDPEFLNRAFRINVFSFIQLTLRALPHLEQSSGHVFITSSMAGETPGAMNAIYSSTKHALNGFFYSLQQELLAKQSPVTLTIGALGLIMTDDFKVLIPEEYLKKMPSFAQGDVVECADGMMNSLVQRPRTFTYPKVFNNLYRAMWYYLPNFHEVCLSANQHEGEQIYKQYNDMAEKFHEKAKEMSFQQGNFN